MTKDEALKLLIEALSLYETRTDGLVNKALAAGKEALMSFPDGAQQCVCGEPNSAGTHRTDGPCLAPKPEQEPVAWMHPEWRNYTRAPSPSVTPKEGWIPLYTTPPQPEQEHFALKHRIAELEGALIGLQAQLAQPEQEPVCDKDPQGCWSVRCQLGNKCKNTPPQRKPLTDEQIEQMWRFMDADGFIKAIEAKLKEKNT